MVMFFGSIMATDRDCPSVVSCRVFRYLSNVLSVHVVTGLPQRYGLQCCRAWTSASSSLSCARYLASAGLNFVLIHEMSCRIPGSSTWDSVAPVAKSLASVCRMYGLSGLGNASVTDFCITSFQLSKSRC